MSVGRKALMRNRASRSRAEIGKFYRPVKKQITLRIDADVLEWFKGKGAGYQTAINEVLRSFAMRRSTKDKNGARTGEPCPASGVWCVEDDHSKSVTLSKGDPMPAVSRKKVKWIRRKAA